MDNFKQPASPQSIAFCGDNPEAQTSWGVHSDFMGFTKLELASLIIAQGALSSGKFSSASSFDTKTCISIAKAVLEEANK